MSIIISSSCLGPYLCNETIMHSEIVEITIFTRTVNLLFLYLFFYSRQAFTRGWESAWTVRNGAEVVCVQNFPLCAFGGRIRRFAKVNVKSTFYIVLDRLPVLRTTSKPIQN